MEMSNSGEKQLLSILAEIQKQLVLMNQNLQLLTKGVHQATGSKATDGPAPARRA